MGTAKITHIQYDGSGEWVDVEFNGRDSYRIPAETLLDTILIAGVGRLPTERHITDDFVLQIFRNMEPAKFVRGAQDKCQT